MPGGDRFNRNDEILLVRTVGKLQGPEDIRNVTVSIRNGVPVHIRDVAEVRIGSMTRYGAVTGNGEGEIVTGLVLLRKGANSRATVEVSSVKWRPCCRRCPRAWISCPFMIVVSQAVWTVEKALLEAVVLVLIVLIVMLGNLRSALTVAIILPLSVLFTFLLMRLFGVTANLMSLGGLAIAIAIAILVDAAVVVVENIHTQLNQPHKGLNRLHLVYRAVLEVATPVLSGVLIIIIVFLPLFSLTGLEGKMFTPLAVTISFALIGSLLLSLTVIPVVASLVMRGGHDKESALFLRLQALYRPVMLWALHNRARAVQGALAALLGAVILFPFLGSEFMPIMDEGTTVIIIEKNPSISLEKSLALDEPYQKAMMSLPEVIGVM